jgi:LexA-binding, inner membrane-associated putative hydrolase
MDIAAHALWAGIGVVALRRRRPITPATAVLAVALAVLPDVLQLLPVLGWWLLADGSWAALRAFVVAVPGQEPGLPQAVQWWSHQWHCVMHSAPVAVLVTALVWVASRSFWLPLLGWWSHIVIDVFTHSADYYAVPVLYPFTERGFDGIAWTTPWFMALNYAALAAAAAWLWWSRRAHQDRGAVTPR